MTGIITKQNYLKCDSNHLSESSTEKKAENIEGELVTESATYEYKPKLVWKHVFIIFGLQIMGIYGLFLIPQAKLLTIVWVLFLIPIGMIGTTMGAHRFYTHRTFKAKKWIEVLLIAMYSTVPQKTMWKWVLDHRQHHKYSDTDADPHNSKRGFFHCHMGWLIYDQHPEVLRTKRTIDLSDLEHNPIILFHKRYYYQINVLVSIVFPTIVPCYFWNENLYTSLIVCYFVRMAYLMHSICSVNSFSHMYGVRPFNRETAPGDNVFVSIFAFGEGWHNYHHAFPWDYRAAQHGENWNVTTRVIDYCAKKGWIYDLKEASPELVKKYCINHGDGSHPVYGKISS